MKLEAVVWIDSGSTDGWVDVDELPCEPVTIHSVGWVAAENDECLILVPHVGQDRRHTCVCGNIAIPKCSIVKRRKLKWPFKV